MLDIYKSYAGYLSAVFAILSYAQIIRSIINKKTIPNKTSWLIWGINDILIFFSSYAGGARNSAILPATCVICGLACIAVSAKYDSLPLSKLDRFCLFSSMVGWCLWIGSSQPLLGLIIGIMVNTLGAFPTWSKIYKEPLSHEPLPWITWMISSYLSVLSVESITLAKLLFPINSAFVSTSSFFMIWWFSRKRSITKSRTI